MLCKIRHLNIINILCKQDLGLFYLETPCEKKDPPVIICLFRNPVCAGHSHTANGLSPGCKTNTCLFENLWLETNIVITWEAAHIASCLTSKMCSPQ